jgi:mannose-6-phosphate isomerase-like protein (cupin superfamily)
MIIGPDDRRAYDMGPRFDVTFMHDDERSSVSEWWLEPGTPGPGFHQHPDDDLFFVLGGTMTFRVGDDEVDAGPGTFVRAPGGTPHDFENRGTERAGFLNVSVPGGFEGNMPAIADSFRERDS